MDSYLGTGQEGAVAVAAAGLTTIAALRNGSKRLLCFHFDVATQNLDQLKVYARAHPSAQLQDFTPADWTALEAGGRIRRSARSTTSSGAIVDGNLNAVTTLQNGYFEMDVDGLAEIVVRASAAADSAAVTPRWSFH
jgi:hypothetical protein